MQKWDTYVTSKFRYYYNPGNKYKDWITKTG